MLKDEKKLWKKMKKSKRKEDVRAELIERYIPLVKKLVNSMAISSFSSIDKDDLIGAGLVGLIEAVDNFNVERGVKFSTFAYKRIKGSIWDYIRKKDIATRTLRRKEKRIKKAFDELRYKFKREPTTEEICEYLDMDEDKYYLTMGKLESLDVLSYNKKIYKDGTDFLSILEDKDSRNIEEKLELKDLKNLIKKIIKNLPEKERLVIILYYYEKLNMKEIGKIIGVSESRISQIRSSTLQRLRNIIKEKI